MRPFAFMAPGGALPVVTSVTLSTTEAIVGNVLSLSIVSSDCDTFTYAWKANGVTVGTASTFTPTRAEMSYAITCIVTGHNTFGDSSPTTSNASDPCMGVPENTVAPLVTSSGSDPAAQGDTLSTTDGTWTGYPAPTFSYTNDGSGGGTNNWVTVGVADSGNNITFTVRAANTVGYSDAPSNAFPCA